MYRMDKRNTTGHSVGRFLQFGMVYASRNISGHAIT